MKLKSKIFPSNVFEPCTLAVGRNDKWVIGMRTSCSAQKRSKQTFYLKLQIIQLHQVWVGGGGRGSASL